ncbi:Trissin receptor [Strongyloides ratti]|uniref:Trissin receptor n=1 Tax=Strongyloides ratti TaxID=34506 RepID=A0A090LH91_STRRB|nr:Trissin receptor [Strongyloides ratti]CEF69142.1 Trissin receptor [Strongyloides ratti]
MDSSLNPTYSPDYINFSNEGQLMGEESYENEESLLDRPLIRNFLIIAYIIVFLFCVIGNILILTVIITKKSMRTITNFLLGNLAVADLLVGIFCVVQTGFHFLHSGHSQWIFGKTMCHCYLYLVNMIPNLSAGILVLLSVERFIAVVRPMLVQDIMTSRVLLMSTALVWTFCIIMNLPYLIAVQYISHEDPETGIHMAICTRKHFMLFDINILKVVSILNLIVWYIIALLILLIIYISIGHIMMKSSRKYGRDNYPYKDIKISITAQDGTIIHKNNFNTPLLEKNGQKFSTNNTGIEKKRSSSKNITSESFDTRRRVIKLVALLVISFAVLNMPRYIYLTWSIFRDVNSPRCLDCLLTLLHPITFLLMFVNSAINPILYAFLSQRFRNAISDTLTCYNEREKKKKKVLENLRFTRFNTKENNFSGSFGGLPTMNVQGTSPNLNNARKSVSITFNSKININQNSRLPLKIPQAGFNMKQEEKVYQNQFYN